MTFATSFASPAYSCMPSASSNRTRSAVRHPAGNLPPRIPTKPRPCPTGMTTESEGSQPDSQRPLSACQRSAPTVSSQWSRQVNKRVEGCVQRRQPDATRPRAPHNSARRLPRVTKDRQDTLSRGDANMTQVVGRSACPWSTGGATFALSSTSFTSSAASAPTVTGCVSADSLRSRKLVSITSRLSRPVGIQALRLVGASPWPLAWQPPTY